MGATTLELLSRETQYAIDQYLATGGKAIAFLDNQAHKRSKLLRLTPDGEAAYAEMDTRVRDLSRRLSAGLDHEDLLLRTRDWSETGAPPLDLLLIDGFHDFTPVQQEIVDRLAGSSRETIVTLPLDDTPVFRTAARTADAFPGLRRERLDGKVTMIAGTRP